jgi:hypothetical protein
VARKTRFLKAEAVPYWALVVFLVLTFLTGGGSRADIQSLIILRPAAVIFCGIALWSLRWEHVQGHTFLFGMAAAIFALVGSHLIPLPPTMWGALPGREIITEIDKVAELGEVWRPLTMVPSGGWNAFYSLFVPLAVLLLGVQLSREERFKLLPWLLGLGLFSGFMGLLQSIGDPQGPLYFYNVTNNGSAVGLFSNRNHQAILLAMLFPMLAVYASTGVRAEEQAKVRGYIALAAGAVLVPLLLVTGSRAGLILGAFGIACTALLYRKPDIIIPKKRRGNKHDLRWLAGGFAVLCLGALTIITSRAEAVSRLTLTDLSGELRFLAWVPIAKMAWKYFPVGSGAGSFVDIFKIDEPVELLGPSYLNHAHNDWLELCFTFGLPGLMLVVTAVFAFVHSACKAFSNWRAQAPKVQHARLGVFLILIMAIGSIGDYPLRTPSIAVVFVLAAMWLYGDDHDSRKSGGILGRTRVVSADWSRG